ncbi:MAG TPA: hypothetical protein VIF37_12870 [Methylobacter sp.]|jgi:hypothetical protein
MGFTAFSAIAPASLQSSATAPELLNYRDVAAAIAPGNLAAFPPSLEVNAENAWSGFLSTSCIRAVVPILPH